MTVAHPPLRTLLAAPLVAAMIGAAAIEATVRFTGPMVERSRAHAVWQQLASVMPLAHDNLPAADPLLLADPELLGTPRPLPAYRAQREGRVVGVVLTVVAPDGYAGALELVVGIGADGRVLGVRVLGHRETPGIGARAAESSWLLGFVGRSLGSPPPRAWTVAAGGAFDAVSGATVTSAAIVRAVYRALRCFERHRSLLLSPRRVPGAAGPQ